MQTSSTSSIPVVDWPNPMKTGDRFSCRQACKEQTFCGQRLRAPFPSADARASRPRSRARTRNTKLHHSDSFRTPRQARNDELMIYAVHTRLRLSSGTARNDGNFSLHVCMPGAKKGVTPVAAPFGIVVKESSREHGGKLQLSNPTMTMRW